MRGFHQGRKYRLLHLKAGYMEAILFSYPEIYLAIRGGPYMTPIFSRSKQKFVIEMLDTVIQQQTK